MKNLLMIVAFFYLGLQVNAQAPVISVTPDSLSENLLSGKTNDQTLTIYNNGGSDLTFEINVKDNLESLFFNQSKDYSLITSTETLETTELMSKNSKSYSGSSTLVDNSFLIEKNEKYFGGNLLAGGMKILLITSGTVPDEIKNALLNFPDVQQVDVFDAYNSTPELSQLLPYHSAIVVNGYPFGDPVALGDVLADYVDAGRGLIMTVASFASGWEITGRLLADDYFPINVGYGPAGNATLGTFNATHPIMYGVTNAFGDLLIDATLANGAELVASWSTGWPFVATKGHNVVAVNIYVADPGYWTGDIPLILHNAAYWASQCGWLSAEPESGTIPAGSSMDITMKFDAAGLIGGEYDANIVIASNDPVTPELIVPAHLTVTNAPAIFTETNSIDFGEIFLGVIDTFYLEVKNIGSQDLLIFNAAIQPSEYTIYPTFAGIDPGENEIFTISFLPTQVGSYPGTLTLTSNDPLYGNYVINLSGQGVEPPVIIVYPDSIVVGVLPGSTRTKTLTVSNVGESNLYFNIVGGFSSLNYALEYNGSTTYVQCENSPSLNMQQSITVEAWIYPFDWNGNRRILQKGNNDDQYVFLGINDYNEGWLHFGIEVEGGGLFPALPSCNIWHHVAGVYNQSSSSMYMYIDGYEVAEKSGINGNINITSDPLFIGTKFDFAPPQDFFNGFIDEVRIWNIARSQSDIQEFMNRQLTGTESGLVGYWQFDEGTGNTTFDKTVNANHGTLFGGVQWTDFTAPILPGWFQMSMDSGVCLPHTSVNIELMFDATEVDTGDYYASVIVYSNDPFTPSVVVPIHMIVSSTVGIEDNLNSPLTFNLYQNYPNPFNPRTIIKYSVPELSKVRLTLFNLLGEEVSTLVNEEKNAGNYSIDFNASNLPSGVYFYQLRAGEFVSSKKMILLK